jgi:hypothetical protein
MLGADPGEVRLDVPRKAPAPAIASRRMAAIIIAIDAGLPFVAILV